MTRVSTKKATAKKVDRVRQSITHPVLLAAYDADWYYPAVLPPEVRKEKCIQKAIKEGWAEWIVTDEDVQAVRAGYVYDLSRDKQGRPIYWMNGHWHRYQGDGPTRRLVKIQYEDDDEIVGYCGAGDHMCRFAELFLRFTKDPMRGQPYRFMAWQRMACMSIFGWVAITKTKDGKTIKYRRFKEAMIEAPKKSAKSDLGSVIAVYLVRADRLNKAYVYGCATGKKQAGIIYGEASDYIKMSEVLSEEIQVIDSQQRFAYLETGSYYQVLSGEAGSNDGPDASGVIFDELHRQKNRSMLSVMKRSGRARRSHFLLLIVTTYGSSLNNIWGEEHLKSKRQLDGTKYDHRRYVMIASAEPIKVVAMKPAKAGDKKIAVWPLEQPVEAGQVLEFEAGGGIVKVTLAETAKRFQPFIECEPLSSMLPAFSEAIANKDWRSDHAIIRSNPSVGIVYPIEEIREDREASMGSPEAEAEFKQLSLNIVSGSGHNWISGPVWQHNAKHRVLMSSLIGQRCFGGADMSFSTDLTAFWLSFPSWPAGVKFSRVDNPLVRLVGMVWLPEEGIEEREEKSGIPYRHYASIPYIGEMGCVRICPGPVVNYQMMASDVLEMCSRFKVQAVAYDPAYSQFVIDPYLAGNLKCIPHRQGSLSMGPPTKRFEELLKRGLVAHGNHPMLDAAIDGVKLSDPDKVGNRFPVKAKSNARIDALIAAVMAVGWTCDPPVDLRGTGAWTGKGTGVFG